SKAPSPGGEIQPVATAARMIRLLVRVHPPHTAACPPIAPQATAHSRIPVAYRRLRRPVLLKRWSCLTMVMDATEMSPSVVMIIVAPNQPLVSDLHQW